MTENESFDPRDESTLESERAELDALMSRYRSEVLDEIEPSAAYRAGMHKMMLGLVSERVLEENKRASFASLVLGRWRRICDCWRELAETSLVFRLTSQMALALGVGLVLSVITIATIDQGTRAGESRLDQRTVPDSMKIDLDIERPGDQDDLPLEIPRIEEEESGPEFGR